MPPTDVQLQDMGLTAIDNVNDESPYHSDWDRKGEVQIAIIASDQPNKPRGNLLWATTRDVPADTTACNMCIHVARLTAVVIGGGVNGTDKDLDEQFYICKKESAVWIKKYLTFSDGESKSNQHLKQASGKETYSVTNYVGYVPNQVRAASDTYITMYYNKHKTANQRLTKAMITISFSSFKCGLPMTVQDEIDEHIYNVHGIEEGATSLKPIQEIDVDTKITFSLPSILDIELVGP